MSAEYPEELVKLSQDLAELRELAKSHLIMSREHQAKYEHYSVEAGKLTRAIDYKIANDLGLNKV